MRLKDTKLSLNFSSGLENCVAATVLSPAQGGGLRCPTPNILWLNLSGGITLAVDARGGILEAYHIALQVSIPVVALFFTWSVAQGMS